MRHVWWNNKGSLYFKLLNPSQTVTSDLFSQQLKYSTTQQRSEYSFHKCYQSQHTAKSIRKYKNLVGKLCFICHIVQTWPCPITPLSCQIDTVNLSLVDRKNDSKTYTMSKLWFPIFWVRISWIICVWGPKDYW